MGETKHEKQQVFHVVRVVLWLCVSTRSASYFFSLSATLTREQAIKQEVERSVDVERFDED